MTDVRLSIADARDLVERVMRALGHDAREAAIIADHLIDCELRGIHYGGLARAVSIAERIARTPQRPEPIRIEKETPVSAGIDGGDRIGYVVAHRATEIAIEKAAVSGIAVVGAHNTWYTGMLSYYGEMAAARGLVAFIASNASPWVAPHGASEGRVGTNPICFAFPSTDAPVIWDIGTSSIMHAEVVLAQRLGQSLPAGVAFDADGHPTSDPASALAGAFTTWGGHKGSGLAIVVQLLGALAGAPAMPPDLANFGFVIVAIAPDLLTTREAFTASVAAFADSVRSARPAAGGEPPRMPFDRSRDERRRRLREGTIDIPAAVHTVLTALLAGARA
jgi:LDH2 family malate/lactate/ureidoglycolate dehydrogenase